METQTCNIVYVCKNLKKDVTNHVSYSFVESNQINFKDCIQDIREYSYVLILYTGMVSTKNVRNGNDVIGKKAQYLRCILPVLLVIEKN